MADEGLLVLGGFYGVRTKMELGLCESEQAHEKCLDMHPSVVFAIRPKMRAILHKHIEPVPGTRDWDPQWYLTIDPPNTSLKVMPPTRGDARRTAGVVVVMDSSFQEAFTLNLDARGREIEGPRDRGNAYLSNQKNLPDVDEFKLIPFTEVLARAGKLEPQSETDAAAP